VQSLNANGDGSRVITAARRVRTSGEFWVGSATGDRSGWGSVSAAGRAGSTSADARSGTLESLHGGRTGPVAARKGGFVVKTIMGWIDRIVSKLARRKINKDEGRSGTR
jgi:hypothetical protein